MDEKTIHKQWSALSELPKGISRPENGDWVIASAEIPEGDSDGDIIRIKGMTTPIGIPLQAQHMRHAPDGSPTTIGKIVEYRDTSIDWNGKSIPARLQRFEWAPSELAAKYKELWPKFVNRVSVGLRIKEAKPIDKGGYDYTDTEQFELSIVTFGANEAARAAIAKALGDDPEDEDEIETEGDESLPLKELTDIIASLDAGLADLTKQLNSRLDDIESKIVVASEGAGPKHDRQDQPKTIDLDLLRDMLNH